MQYLASVLEQQICLCLDKKYLQFVRPKLFGCFSNQCWKQTVADIILSNILLHQICSTICLLFVVKRRSGNKESNVRLLSQEINSQVLTLINIEDRNRGQKKRIENTQDNIKSETYSERSRILNASRRGWIYPVN